MHRLLAALFGLVLVAALSGCGEDAGSQSDTTTSPATATTSPATPTGTQPPAAEGETVATANTDLGEILVDGEGRTLYLFTNDSPGESACEGPCLDAWPILEGEATAGEGVDASLLGTIERSDGTTQATYQDWPLYYYAEDTEAGELKGQGVGEVWWVIDAEGNAVKAAADTGRGGGY